MPLFEIHTEGVARSMYRIPADNEDDARKKINAGYLTEAESVEIDGEEIVEITEYTP